MAERYHATGIQNMGDFIQVISDMGGRLYYVIADPHGRIWQARFEVSNELQSEMLMLLKLKVIMGDIVREPLSVSAVG